MDRLTDFNSGNAVGKSFPSSKSSLMKDMNSISYAESHDKATDPSKMSGLEGMMIGPSNYGPLMGMPRYTKTPQFHFS